MSTTQIRSTLRKLNIVFITMLVFTSGAAGIGIVSAQSDPGDPQSFYGDIESEDGTPAPEGTEVFALIDGSVEDSIEIDEAGQYGGPDTLDDRLDVNTGAGDEVVFTVGSPDGPEALESPFDLEEADQTPFELDLTFPAGTFTEGPDFSVTIDEDESTLDAIEGDDLTVVADIENTGEEAGVQDITAVVGDDLVASADDVSLDPGEETSVPLTFTAETEFDGEDVVVASEDSTDTASLTVTAAQGDFAVTINEDESTLEAVEGDDLSVTVIVENQGTGAATQDITATVGADQVAVESDVTLDPGTETEVTLDFPAELVYDGADVVVASNDDEDTAQLTVTEPDDPVEEPSFDVSIDADASTLEGDEGDDLTVAADIENIGAAAGTQDITATVGDTQVGIEEDVSLDPDEETSVTFVFTGESAFDGEDIVVASDDATAVETLTVSTSPPSGGGTGGGTGGTGSAASSFFEVTDLDPIEATVTQGEIIDISATITNTGDLAAQQTLELRLDGETIEEDSVVLSSDGGTETIVFENVDTSELEGDFEHSIASDDDEAIGTLTVTVDDDTDADDDDTDADDDDTDADDDDTDVDDAEDDTPGFGAIVALVALIAAALLATRRRN